MAAFCNDECRRHFRGAGLYRDRCGRKLFSNADFAGHGAAERAKANGFVTTAKDAVKLSPAMRAILQRVGPVAVGDIDVTICDEARFVSALMRLLPHSSFPSR